VIGTENRIIPGCYVLSLESPGGKRYESASQQLARFPFDPIFVEGIRFRDGETLSSYSPWLNLLRMKRGMTPGEVSVYLGHRKIWQRMLDDGQKLALVLEDDFFIQDDDQFIQAIDDAVTVSPHWDIVKFFDYRPKRPIQRWRVNRTEFVIHKYTSSGCVAYLINAAKAERLLQQTLVYRPIDEDWSHPWEKNLRIISVDPNPVIEIAPALGGSLLECERKRTKSYYRNWLRSLYGNVLALNKTARSLRWKRRMANLQMPELRSGVTKGASTYCGFNFAARDQQAPKGFPFGASAGEVGEQCRQKRFNTIERGTTE